VLVFEPLVQAPVDVPLTEVRRADDSERKWRAIDAGVGPPGTASPVDTDAAKIAVWTPLRAVLFPPKVESGGLCVIVALLPVVQPARLTEASVKAAEAATAMCRVEVGIVAGVRALVGGSLRLG
jgi:hypothetical protein